MCSLKLKKVEVSPNRFFGAMMAIGCLMFAGASILGLRDALQRGEIAWVITLSLFLLVFFGTLVLALVVVISDHTFDEVLDEDLVRWWRKKGANVARGLARRLLYLLGAAACFWAVYGLYLMLKRLETLGGAFGWSVRGYVFLVFLFTGLAGLALLDLAIIGILKKFRPRKSE